MLISIIVPVYNTEQYIGKCLDSIIMQSYKNVEIILVDDGSTDRSLEICMDYAKRDSRITVLQEQHMGLAATRKRGVEKAQGLYCIFVDSDDWIDNSLVETLIPFTEGGTVDVVNYNMRSVSELKVTDWRYGISEGTYENGQLEEIYKRMMFDFENGYPGIIQSICTKLTKRTVLRLCIEPIDYKISLGEDAAITYNVMLNSKKIVVTNKVLYYYRMRQGSMFHSKDIDIFTNVYYFQEYMKKIFGGYNKRYGLEKQLEAYLMSFIKKGIGDVFSLKIRDLYRIPFKPSDLGNKIVLYGAGNVGRSYYRQLRQSSDVEMVAWIDKGLKEAEIYDYKIKGPEILDTVEFDKILIAVMNQETADEIKKQLCRYSSKELLWDEPKINWWEKEIDL